jgi:hypothetical protein
MKRTKMLVYIGGILLPLGIALAANAPSLKEGLWSVHTVTINNPGNQKSEGTVSICRSHAYDESVEALAKNMKGCTTISESFEGGKRSVDMRCTVATSVIETKGKTTFDGDTSAHSEIHATYTPAMAGISEMTMIQDQKYVGSCPAGVQPGDRISADGTVMHSQRH